MTRARELFEPNAGDARYVRRNEQVQFTIDQVRAHRSLSRDNDQQAPTRVRQGQGDKGDRKAR